MKLYSYQENALLAIDSDPSHSQLISMPTGTGKTITFLAAIKRKNKKCLVLVHRNELLDQTREKAKTLGFLESDISVINSCEKGNLRLLTIAMVQSLNRNLDKYDPEEVEMIVIDEAHHATADSYKKVLKYFQVFEKKKMLLGFTATPLRGDKDCLGDIFQSHSFKMTLSEATQNGYICPVHGLRVDIRRSLENIDALGGDYNPEQLEKVMNCDSINELIVSRCEHLEKVPAIIFTTSVDHAEKLAALLKERGRKAASVSYRSTKDHLKKVFDDLKSGELHFITNAVKLSEGFDYPPIQTVILARPTRSPVLYKQMIGRGLRNHPEKYDCFVLEFSGNDPKMICWEDIDQNCTFQATTLEEKQSRKEALGTYRAKFGAERVKVIDVRVSPFKFYECNIRRIFGYRKEFRALPYHEGFCVFQFIRVKKPKVSDIYGFNCHVHMCFWEKMYKSFFVWDGGGPLWQQAEVGWTIEECEKQALHFANCQAGGLSRWYPSEEEPITRKQKSFLKNPMNTSARKAEMHIEECAIKQAIQKYWIDSIMPEIDGENPEDETSTFKEITDRIKHKRTIFQLTGVYL